MTATFTTLIDATTLLERFAAGAPTVVVDTGFDLSDTAAGEREWRAGHLPGSVYLQLERDLSGSKTGADGVFRGRHPLPDRADFARALGAIGIGRATQVVVLDRQGGVYASRLWWMLRWMGHDAVAVLDGGLQAWMAAGGTVDVAAALPQAEPPYPDRPPLASTTTAADLASQLGRVRLVDARAPERFRGEVEPLDAAAGHIPGALNRCFKDNLGADGRFKPAAVLRTAFDALAGGHGAAAVVHQCGSGVTACHNLLAMEHAGLAGSVLYPGSWSEWSADPTRPVARG